MGREGRTSSAIIEIKSIIDDCKLQVIGGALVGRDIWEIALVPSLLTNAETWVNISKNTIEKLEDLQIKMFRSMLGTPKSTPPSIILWDLGSVKMEYRVMEKKLNYFNELVNLPEDTLAKEILKVQIKNDD